MAANPESASILDALRQIQLSQTQLLTSVETLMERMNTQESKATIASQTPAVVDMLDYDESCTVSTASAIHKSSKESKTVPVSAVPVSGSRSNQASRIVLTGGSYAIYYALAVASKELNTDHRVPDGKVCLNKLGELAVTKIAVEPVWYLPGVAERFGIDEGTLRRSLFEHTGGSYPELITRGDLKVFLPPIGYFTSGYRLTAEELESVQGRMWE
ncbi:hypothetical protein E4U41_006680, partial [Claviceps citrina]